LKPRATLFAAVAAALVLAPAAAAHVEISPSRVAADSVARFMIEIPAERNVPTVKIEVKLPSGLGSVRLAARPGWKSTNRSGVVTWSGGKIEPGHSGKFAFSAHVPNTPRGELVFPTLQTYANGEIVRWIGAPTSDTPAPRVTLGTDAVSAPAKTASGGFPVKLAIALVSLIGVGMVGLFALRRVLLRFLD
jgi:uncharacterized protein YcnI